MVNGGAHRRITRIDKWTRSAAAAVSIVTTPAPEQGSPEHERRYQRVGVTGKLASQHFPVHDHIGQTGPDDAHPAAGLLRPRHPLRKGPPAGPR
jgi:hypothetical protein